MTDSETTPIFPDLMAQRTPPVRNSDVARATGYNPSQTFNVLHGHRLVYEKGYRNMPGELTILAAYFDLSPDKIRRISQATVAWRLQQSVERTTQSCEKPTSRSTPEPSSKDASGDMAEASGSAPKTT